MIMKTKLSLLVVSMLTTSSFIAAGELSPIPPNAKAGECYAKVVIPAQYVDKSAQILVKEASSKIEVIPTKFETVEEKVLIEPEGKQLVVVPAKYKKVAEDLMVEPAQKIWKTSLKKNAALVSSEMLASVKGVDLKAAESGTCYSEYFKAESYKAVKEDITIQKATEKLESIPAEYRWVEKKLMMKPETKKIVEVAAVYDIKEEKILVDPAKTIWKKGANPAESLQGATGEIMCLVDIPAKYKTMKKKVLVSKATTKEVVVPAEYKIVKVSELVKVAEVKKIKVPAVIKTITKKELVTKPEFQWVLKGDKTAKGWKHTGKSLCLIEVPAKYKKLHKSVLAEASTVKEVAIAAKYKTIKVQRLASASKTVKIPIPSEYKTVIKRSKVTDSKMNWERILCQTNMNDAIIGDLQQALSDNGYDVGGIDGRLGRGTYGALEKYQKENALATGGITYETLIALGIKKK